MPFTSVTHYMFATASVMTLQVGYTTNICEQGAYIFGFACRQNRQSEKSAVDVERLKPLNESIDSYSVNLSATNDDVNLQWHQQQRQQLVM